MVQTKQILALAVVAIAAIVFASTLINSTVYSIHEETDSGVTPASTPQTGKGTVVVGEHPARLVIPKIGVNAHVQKVGIARSGNMAVPTNYTDVGWYRQGTIPGRIGSAVMDGHVDNGFGLSGVFGRLNELEEGDDIYVETENGDTYHFVVEESAMYTVEDVPLQKLFSRNDAARLNLVTCDGTWLADERMYDERYIVYAKLIE